MHLIVLSGVSVSSHQYCLLHAGTIVYSCVVVLQEELQYIHFGEHMTLAASLMTMAIVIGTYHFLLCRVRIKATPMKDVHPPPPPPPPPAWR